MKAHRSVTTALLCIMVIGGCSNHATSGGTTSTTVTTSSSSSPVTEPSTTVDDEASPTAAENSSDASATSGPVIAVESGERTLTLQDARASTDWTEGNFTPVGSDAAVQGLRTELNCFGSDPKTLELRFARTTGELKVNVAQDMDSQSPHLAVEFKLIADDKRVDIKTIKFKDPAVLRTNLAGVTVVEISARIAPDSQSSCSTESTNALITGMTVTS